MSWRSAYQEKGRYRARESKFAGSAELKALPTWAKQAIICCFILTVLLGASASRAGLAGVVATYAKGAVEGDLSFDQVKAWVLAVPEHLGKLADLDIRGFWSGLGKGDPGDLAWPVSGQVSSYYGWRPNEDSAGSSLHEGIDIDAPSGASVASSLDGVVVSVYESPTYGLVIEIEHAGGLTTLYGNLGSSLVEASQRVKKGQSIATVGQGGEGDRPHLHFEVRKDGLGLDPMPILPPLVKGP